MQSPYKILRLRSGRFVRWHRKALSLLSLMLPLSAHASMFKGETLDKVANGAAWVVLIIAPIIGITVFLLVHILPEKIAEKKQHPQAKAIQCLCLLSLAFGGMLWPLAWLWAYTKPVLHKMAYGTDKVPHDQDDAVDDAAGEVDQLRKRIAELEARLASTSAAESGKA
jgi:CBS domain containing-hemolysin-like protein